MWVLIHEFTVGGGLAAQPLPPGLAAEGAAMLRAVLEDWRRLPGHQILTMSDERFDWSDLPADSVVPVSDPAGYKRLFRECVRQADAVLLIAPESGGILAELTAVVEAEGRLVLGSTAEAVRLTGDKLACAHLIAAAGVPTPMPVPVYFATGVPGALPVLASVGYPAVLKPVDGVDAMGVVRVDAPADVPLAWPVVRQFTDLPACLAQPWVEGTHASVSLLVGAGGPLPLSLNGQVIRGERALAYEGGVVPLAHAQQDAAFAAAIRACQAVPGLRGFVGVDLVLGPSGPEVIEINPRLTTAYVGLRRVSSWNLAAGIWAAAAGEPLPAEPPPLVGQAVFGKAGSMRLAVRGAGPCS